MTKNNRSEKNKTSLHNYARYSSIALQMMVVVAVGVWGGVQLDQLLELKFPILTILLSFVSVATAIYLAIKDVINSNKKNDE